MKMKLLLASLLNLLCIQYLWAATTYSPTTPMSGAYAVTTTNFCTVDSTNIPSSNGPTSYNSASVGAFTFTPDKTYGGISLVLAFQSWVSYLMTKSIPSPIGLLNVTQDPTAANGIKLSETPIEWGVMSGSETEAFFNTPYSYKPTNTNGAGNRPIFITQFNYSIPANNNNIAKGYALYGWTADVNAWKRLVIYFTKPVSQAQTTFAAQKVDQESSNLGYGTYLFDCVLHMNGNQ